MFPLLVQPWFTTGYHGCGCRWWVFHRLGDWRLVVFRYEEPIAHLWGFFVPMKTGILPWGTSGPWGSIRGPGKQHYTSTCRSLFGSQTGWQDGLVNKNIFISYKMGIFHQCTSEWWFQSYLFIFTKWINWSPANQEPKPSGVREGHEGQALFRGVMAQNSGSKGAH